MTHTPLDLLAALTPDDITRRLAEIDAERRALMTLLRSVRQRRGAHPEAEPQSPTEGSDDE